MWWLRKLDNFEQNWLRKWNEKVNWISPIKTNLVRSIKRKKIQNQPNIALGGGKMSRKHILKVIKNGSPARMDGWANGGVDGHKSHFKDCFQQSKVLLDQKWQACHAEPCSSPNCKFWPDVQWRRELAGTVFDCPTVWCRHHDLKLGHDSFVDSNVPGIQTWLFIGLIFCVARIMLRHLALLYSTLLCS